MGRFLAGVAAALLLAAAGVLWWNGRAAAPSPGWPAPAPTSLLARPAANEPAPEATAQSREQRRMGRYDKDRDGRVTREEYLEARRKAFARLDSDHDGRLSFDEWAIKAETKFAAADGDKSGVLDAGEFATTAVKRRYATATTPCPAAVAASDD